MEGPVFPLAFVSEIEMILFGVEWVELLRSRSPLDIPINLLLE